MEREDALREIRGLGGRGKFCVTSDSLHRARERDIVSGDVRRALAEASVVEESREDRSSDWTVVGRGLDDEELELSVVLDDDVVVIALDWR